jgi:hypothetical protein
VVQVAVVEIERRPVRAVQGARVARRAPPQIFVAHTAVSRTLLGAIQNVIKKETVRPFIADHEDHGTNPAEKMTHGMRGSDALFVVLTKNALRRQATRDWILFEVGLARAVLRTRSAPATMPQQIFVWKDVRIKLPKTSPLKLITDHRPLNTRSKRSRDRMLDEMKTIARSLSILRRL